MSSPLVCYEFSQSISCTSTAHALTETIVAYYSVTEVTVSANFSRCRSNLKIIVLGYINNSHELQREHNEFIFQKLKSRIRHPLDLTTYWIINWFFSSKIICIPKSVQVRCQIFQYGQPEPSKMTGSFSLEQCKCPEEHQRGTISMLIVPGGIDRATSWNLSKFKSHTILKEEYNKLHHEQHHEHHRN